MAYLRWFNSDWYVFWVSSVIKEKEEEMLAVWYSMSDAKELTYTEVKDFVKEPNWKLWKAEVDDENKEMLINSMVEWANDVDLKWAIT